MKRYVFVAPIALLFLGFLIAQNNEPPVKSSTEKNDSKSNAKKNWLDSLTDEQFLKLVDSWVFESEHNNITTGIGKTNTGMKPFTEMTKEEVDAVMARLQGLIDKEKKKDAKSTTETGLESLSNEELYKIALMEQRGEKANPDLKTDNADTEWNSLKRDMDSKIEENNKKIEQRKKELAAKKINIETITPSEIQKLIEEKVLTSDDLELFPKEKLNLISARTLMTLMDAEVQCLIMTSVMLCELQYLEGVPEMRMTPKLQDAIKEFQRSIGAKETGELSWGELDKLTKQYEHIVPEGVVLPLYRYFYFDAKPWGGSDQINLEGTWVFKYGESQAIPIQTSKIQLDQRSMTGVEALAEIDYDSLLAPKSWLSVEIIRWKITKWDDKEVVAENDAPINASYTLSVDRQNEKVYEYRHPKGKVNDEFVLEPKLLELVNGSNAADEFFRKQNDKRLESYSPKYRAFLEQMKKKVQQILDEQDKKDSKIK